MVFPGHLSGGYLATKALIALGHPAITTSQTNVLFIIGMLASIAPDFDQVAFLVEHKLGRLNKNDSHRKYFTHAPLFWFLATAILFGIGALLHSTYTEYIALAILCGSWSHFILDSIEYGIMWLWPFSRMRLRLKDVNPENEKLLRSDVGSIAYNWHFITRVYFRNISFYLEILISVIAILVYVKVL